MAARRALSAMTKGLPAPARGMAYGYSAVFLFTGAALPYYSVFLDARGLDGQTIGVATALAMVARFIGSLAGGLVVDRTNAPRRVMRFAALAGAVMVAALLLVRDPWLVIALTVVCFILTAPLIPVLEAVGIASARHDGFSYGLVRAMGSVTFIIATFVVAPLIAPDVLGPNFVVVWMAGALVVFAVTTQLVPKPPPRPATPIDWRAVRALFSRSDVLLAFTASALIQGGHAFYYGFGSLVWLDAGYSEAVVGLLWGWGVAAEVIFLAVFGPRAERLGPAMLLVFGAVSGIVRWTLTGFEPGLAALFVLQTLHAATFGAAHLGVIIFLGDRIPRGFAGTAQAVNGGLTLGAAMALATLGSGVLYQRVGAQGYWVMALMCAAGLIAALALVRQPEATTE